MSAATDAAKANLNAYQAVDSGTALKKANQEYDVGSSQTRLSALKGIVGNLQSSVEAVDPSVTGRTSGTFTTEGQRQALVNKERQPILGELGKQQSALTSEQGDLTQKQTLASQMASALLNDDKSKYQRLLDQYNTASAEDKAAEDRRRTDEQSQQWAKQFAESQRQFNETLAANKVSKTSSGSGGTNGYKVSSSKTGGLSFSGPDGPLTAAQYASVTGKSIASLLSSSGDPNDKKILGEIAKGIPYSQLAAKYPWVFGGV